MNSTISNTTAGPLTAPGFHDSTGLSMVGAD